MAPFVPWDSQPIDEWARRHAAGKFVDLDGQPTHYVERGSGEPVILIHGFVYDWFTWHNNIDALSERYKVYAPDLYGFGYSSRAPLDHGYPLYAQQLLHFMDALEIPRASLVGHSNHSAQPSQEVCYARQAARDDPRTIRTGSRQRGQAAPQAGRQ
jgi:hypothetical protein